MDNIETYRYDSNSDRYKLRRKYNMGRIAAVSFGTALTIAVVGLGTIKVRGLIKENDMLGTMAYNSSYSSFSEQIEKELGIDLDYNLEEDLNSMKMMRETIGDYMNDNALISQADAFKILLDNKQDFEQSALRIAKSWCANQYGGDKGDWKIGHEDSKHPVWIATSSSYGYHTLTDDSVCELLDAIGKSQSNDKSTLLNTENPDKYVSLCDKIAKYSGVVASDIAQTKSK